ncbi:MAG: sensor histidine kinase [Myxococcales bacterium]
MKVVLPEEPTRLERSRAEVEPPPRAAGEDLERVVRFARTVATDLGEILREEDVLAAIGHLAIDHLAEGCWVHLIGGAGELKVAAAWQADHVPDLSLPEGHGERLREMLRTGANDVSGTQGSPATLMVPVSFAGDIVGALTLVFAAAPPGPTEIAMAEDLAMNAGAALGRSRIHREATKALAARDDAFAAAAHEFGNPLNALRLQLDALVRTANVEPPVLARMFAMGRLIKQLADLNRRMLDTSRLAAGQLDLRLEDVDLTAIIEDVLASNADQIAWSKLAVSFSSPGPVVGRWDRLRLEQVVANLVSNAMKYGRGGIIAITVDTVGDRARLRVRDNGIGIAERDHERIFERFERASSVQATSSLGIGLWVVRKVVEALGGTIRVESSLGAGATFTVELPRKARNFGKSGGTTS